jgi:hypothetical protein
MRARVRRSYSWRFIQTFCAIARTNGFTNINGSFAEPEIVHQETFQWPSPWPKPLLETPSRRSLETAVQESVLVTFL